MRPELLERVGKANNIKVMAGLLCADHPRPDITRNKGVRPELIEHIGQEELLNELNGTGCLI